MANDNDIKLTQLFQIEHRRSRVLSLPGLYMVNYIQSKLQTLKGAWSSAAGCGAVAEVVPIDHGSVSELQRTITPVLVSVTLIGCN